MNEKELEFSLKRMHLLGVTASTLYALTEAADSSMRTLDEVGKALPEGSQSVLDDFSHIRTALQAVAGGLNQLVDKFTSDAADIS